MMIRDAGQPALLDCREAASALYDFLDGRLAGATTTSVQQHIDTCAECASHYAFARRVLDLIPTSFPIDSSIALRARIVASLQAEGYREERD